MTLVLYIPVVHIDINPQTKFPVATIIETLKSTSHKILTGVLQDHEHMYLMMYS